MIKGRVNRGLKFKFKRQKHEPLRLKDRVPRDVGQNNKYFFLDERNYENSSIARWKNHLN